MATTPTYSWPIPDDTDLVKDGAEAIRDLGNAIDTTVDGLGVGLVHIDTVTYTGVASISMPDNIFSADYTFYKAIGFHTVGSTYNLRLRAGGSDNSTAGSYEREHVFADGSTSIAASYSANTQYQLGIGRSTQSSFELTFVNPFGAVNTHMFHHSNRTHDRMQYYTGTCIHTQAVSYDSFSLLSASGNFTSGKILIFGYKE
jgi:hypothetical protein